MRLAIFSDTHGNPIALDAVLADIQAQGGVDGYWVLGDLVAIGYDPVGVLERLTALPNVTFVQGNTDRYVTEGDRPYPSIPDATANNELIPRLVEVSNTFAWTQGYVTSAGWFEWLARLPFSARLTLPDGTRMLGVHVAPDRNDGEGIHPKVTDETLQIMLADCDADLVVVGHMHWPLDRTFGNIRLVNDGCVSNPWAPDLRASYVLLTATESGYQVELRRVSYSHDDVIAAIKRSHHPAAEYIVSHQRGQMIPWWER
jgi:predicted phosphodiesterase